MSQRPKGFFRSYFQYMIDDAPVIWVLGGPGSGKSELCEKIVKNFDFVWIEPYELVVKEIEMGSNKGRELEELIDNYQLITPEMIICLIQKYYLLERGSAKGYVIDGYPLELHYALKLERMLGGVDLIVYIKCTEDFLLRRSLNAPNQPTYRTSVSHKYMKDMLTNIRVLEYFAYTMLKDLYKEKTFCVDGEMDSELIFQDVRPSVARAIKRKGKKLPKCSISYNTCEWCLKERIKLPLCNANCDYCKEWNAKLRKVLATKCPGRLDVLKKSPKQGNCMQNMVKK